MFFNMYCILKVIKNVSDKMCRMKMRRVENGNVYIYQDKVLLYELYSNLYMFLMYISLVYFYIVCKIKNKIFDVGLVIFFFGRENIIL